MSIPACFDSWFSSGRYTIGPVNVPIDDRRHCVEFDGGYYVELISDIDHRPLFMVTVSNSSEIFDDIDSAARFLWNEFVQFEIGV